MPAPVLEEFYDPQYMRTRFALRWEAPEFEGVEELDPELWKGDNGFT